MIFGFWIGLFGIILIGFAPIAIGSFIAKKMKKKGAIGGLIGFFLGFTVMIYLFITANSLYVVTADKEYDSYWVFGSGEYKKSDGETIPVIMKSDELMVINDSDTLIVMEEIKYGSIFKGGKKWLERGEARTFEGGKIHYFFDDKPPEEIQTKSDDGKELRWYLRAKRGEKK